jgi:hypothetical protein
MLSFCRALIALRRGSDDLLRGAYEPLAATPGVWAFRRGVETTVALNLRGEPAPLDLPGAVRLRTGSGGRARLGPWEGVVLEGDAAPGV